MSLNPRDAGAAIALLARAVPDLSPRSPALVRAASWTAGPGPTALAGRPDRIDASGAHGVAVEVWERLRTWIRAGDGEDVAVLWTAHAALQVVVDAADRPLFGPEHRARQQRAIALGAAPSTTRARWKTTAGEEPRLVAHVAEQEVANTRQADDEGDTRTIVHRHLYLVGASGPSVATQAAAWGAEQLALLWHPAPPPEDHSRAVAMGFAPANTRAAWDSTRSKTLREAAERAWGEMRLLRAEERWRWG